MSLQHKDSGLLEIGVTFNNSEEFRLFLWEVGWCKYMPLYSSKGAKGRKGGIQKFLLYVQNSRTGWACGAGRRAPRGPRLPAAGSPPRTGWHGRRSPLAF